MGIQDLRDSPAELKKLAHILERTSSDHDGEILVAARKAQAILRRHNSNFKDLLNDADYSMGHQRDIRVQQLQRQIAQQEREIARLDSALRQANRASKETDEREKGPSRFLGTYKALRNFLLNNFTLQNYEAKLLEQMDDVEPNTKQAYMVLICARRYGVAYENTGNA